MDINLISEPTAKPCLANPLMTIIRTLAASGYPGAFLASLAAFTARDRTNALIYGKLKAFMLSVRNPRQRTG